jgi:uncharacterized membrane protein
MTNSIPAAAMSFVMPAWWPWALGVFLVVAVVLGWRFIGAEHAHFSRKARAGMWVLRTATGLLLLLLILDWRAETTRTESEKPLIQALLDNSASMARGDAAGGQSRFGAAQQFFASHVSSEWNDAERLHAGLAGDGYRDGLSGAAPDARRSALGRSLREVMENHADQPLGGVVLFTDGAASDEEELRAVMNDYREARVPVFPWVIGTPSQPDDVRIVSARVAQPSASQPNMRVEMRLDSPGFAGRKVALSVKFGDQLLDERALVLDGKPQELSFEFVSPYRGLNFYRIAVEVLDGEATAANNEVTAAGELRREPIRVLYMEGSEPSETAYLRDGLQADPEMEVTCLHFPGNSSLAALAQEALRVRGKDMRVFKDGLGRDVPSVCHPTRGYPQTLEELLKYDVIIFSDIIKEAYTPEQLDATVAFVEEFGGGFVMVGGMTSFGAGDYQKTVIDKLMPIEVANRSDPLWVNVNVNVSEAGWQHPIMQVGAGSEETRDAWTKSFPGLRGLNFVQRAKPGAYVLARTAGRTSYGDDLVVLAVQQIGRGRTMAFTSDSTVDWGTEFQTIWGPGQADNSYYRKFWNNTVRWLAADRIARKGGQAVIETSSPQAAPGETVLVRVPAASPTTHAGLELALIDADKKKSNLPLQWNGAQHCWEANLTPAAEGELVIEASYRNEEGERVTTRSGVSVRHDQTEEVAVAARAELMEELAAATGGVVVDEKSVGEVLDRIAAKALPVTWKRNIPLWDRWWLLLPILILVVLEWVVRRRREPVGV